jgi:NADPH:quinone reductase-like Zn-dependent oxidoreductase
VKALVQVGYGLPADVLVISDVPRPAATDHDVVVRVMAASVNALDWHTTRGIPKVIRLSDGVPAPRKRIRGVDLSGIVESVGKDVTTFRPGDRVFGSADGSFAELAVTPATRLVPLPQGVSFEQGATLCVAGLTALQALRDKARLRAGQHVLVLGAGGGVGTFAVQLARCLGARVTAATRASRIEPLRALGADAVVDYGAAGFPSDSQPYDAIVVVGGDRPLGSLRRALRPSGSLVFAGGPTDRVLALVGRILLGGALSPFTGHRVVGFVAKHDAGDLAELAQLVASCRLRPVVGRVYPLDRAADAITYVGSGAAHGKVVVSARA